MLYVAPLGQIRQDQLLFVTRASMCKLVEGTEFDVAKRTIAATKLAQDDELVFVGSAGEMEQVVFQSNGGYFLRFLKQEISTARRAALGVHGMKLAQEDYDGACISSQRSSGVRVSYQTGNTRSIKYWLGKRDTRGIKPRS